MRYRFFTLEQAKNAVKQAASSNAMHMDSVFRPTRLEQIIFEDAGGHSEDKLLAELFHMLYATDHRSTVPDQRTPQATIRASILNEMMDQSEYAELRHSCMGNDFAALETAKMLEQAIAEMQKRLTDAAGKLALVLSRLLKKQCCLHAKMQDCMNEVQKNNAKLHETLRTAEQFASVTEQLGVVQEMLSDALRTQLSQEKTAMQAVIQSGLETAQTAVYASACWGTGDGTGKEKAQQNKELLQKLKNNTYLQDITRQLGRMKEVLSALRKNAYAHGRGEKFSLTRGRDLQNLLSGELALLASPATTPLFMRRYAAKGLVQYAKREKIRKGRGDVIVCLDESGSTCGENAAWGKALALAVQDICAHEGRKFALIHFSGKDEVRTDRFLPGKFTAEELFAAAEHFFDGGTNFEAPLTEALRLLREEEFSKADILFVTDGYCDISDELAEHLQAEISAERCSVIGLLMDRDSAGNAFSLERFCEKVLRMSAMDNESAELTIMERFLS